MRRTNHDEVNYIAKEPNINSPPNTITGNIQESDQLLKILNGRSFIGIYIVQDRKFLLINQNAASYAGYTPEELIGQKADSILHPDDMKMVNRCAREMLRGKRTSPYEFRIITKNGDIRWIKEVIMSISFEGRWALMGNSMDITEHKLAEEALQKSRRRFGDLIEFLPDTTFAIDLEGRLIAWNHAAEEMTGVKAKDVLGTRNHEYALPFWKIKRPMCVDLVLKANRKYEKTYDAFKRERGLVVVEVEVPGIQTKGKNACLWGKASPLYDSKGNIIGSLEIIRDITERKLAEEIILKRGYELGIKSHELGELNAALKVLLKQREGDKAELEERLLVNVRELVLPYAEKLKKRQLHSKDMAYINILDANLRNILSPFTYRLSSKYLNLTSREFQIINLIKEGNSSKEIADLLNVSCSTINIYRYRIRKKMGLKKENNLKMYLSSLEC